jgi:DNA-binding Xre family transcriptional regulator
MRTLTYDPLWKKLIDLKMTKTELAEKASISRGIITRMGKNDLVTLDAIVKICNALDCDVIDVMSVLPSENEVG